VLEMRLEQWMARHTQVAEDIVASHKDTESRIHHMINTHVSNFKPLHHESQILQRLVSAQKNFQITHQLSRDSRRDKSLSNPRPVTKSTIVHSKPGFLQRVTSHWLFDGFYACLIVVNAVALGLQVDLEARFGSSDPVLFGCFELMCTTLFTVELVCRLVALKSSFFKSRWNWFDAALVGTALVDMALYISYGGWWSRREGNSDLAALGKIIRVFRMLRILRIFRVLRYFHELRLMTVMMLNACKSLGQLMVLLFMLIYTFGVFFAQAASKGMTDVVDEKVTKYYGRLGVSLYSLFLAVSGGISWGEVAMPLWTIHWSYMALFLMFISFSLFAMLNVVTGVFVEGVGENSKMERDIAIQSQMKTYQEYISKLRCVFEDIDQNNDGVITIEEFHEHVSNERLASYLQALQIDTSQVDLLFSLLDKDDSDEIQIEEFLEGCLKIKGDAKSIDIHTLLFQNRRILHKVQVFMTYAEAQFSNLAELLGYMIGISPSDAVLSNESAVAANHTASKQSTPVLQ